MTQPLTDAINALTRYANETTGQSDTTLSGAVRTLCDGYGGGGGYSIDDIALNLEPSGEVTITAIGVSSDAFRSKPITRVKAPNVTYAQAGAFTSSGLTRIEGSDFPLLTEATGAFEECKSLTYVKLTSAIENFEHSFQNCPNLKEAYFPNATGNISKQCFGCKKLTVMDCGSGDITHSYSFYNCDSLRTLVLRKTTGVQSLKTWSENCLGGIHENPTKSEIYVPSALIESYQTASSWKSAYKAGVTFKPIEGSIYE